MTTMPIVLQWPVRPQPKLYSLRIRRRLMCDVAFEIDIHVPRLQLQTMWQPHRRLCCRMVRVWVWSLHQALSRHIKSNPIDLDRVRRVVLVGGLQIGRPGSSWLLYLG